MLSLNFQCTSCMFHRAAEHVEAHRCKEGATGPLLGLCMSMTTPKQLSQRVPVLVKHTCLRCFWRVRFAAARCLHRRAVCWACSSCCNSSVAAASKAIMARALVWTSAVLCSRLGQHAQCSPCMAATTLHGRYQLAHGFRASISHALHNRWRIRAPQHVAKHVRQVAALRLTAGRLSSSWQLAFHQPRTLLQLCIRLLSKDASLPCMQSLASSPWSPAPAALPSVVQHAFAAATSHPSDCLPGGFPRSRG